MPNAVMHIILTIIVIDLFRDYFLPKHHMHKFPKWIVLAGGIAGLAPDLDMPFGWIYNWINGTSINFHGGITHIILIPIVIALVGFFLHARGYKVAGVLCWVVAFGWFFHLALDCVFLGAYNPLWPLQGMTFCPHTFSAEVMPGFDAILLIVWLLHEELKHKIKDYI